MKDLFLLVSDAIKEVTEVRWVDFEMGQLEQEFPPVSFPCCLFAFNVDSYEDLGAGTQIANTVIDIRIAFKVFERTHSQTKTTPTDFRAKGLEHLTIIDLIHNKLDGLNAEGIGSLSRISYNNEKRADLRVYKLSYTAQVTTTPPPVFIPPNEVDPPFTPEFCNTVVI